MSLDIFENLFAVYGFKKCGCFDKTIVACECNTAQCAKNVKILK